MGVHNRQPLAKDKGVYREMESGGDCLTSQSPKIMRITECKCGGDMG